MIIKNLNDFELSRVILHNVNKKDNIKILSDLPIDIDDSLDKLIKIHIFNSINDEKRRLAKFNASHSNIKLACMQCLNNTVDDFIDGSKVIADALYDKMQARIKPASLLIAKYIYLNKQYIGFLKLDYTQNLALKEEEINGKIRLSIQQVGNGIPNSRHKLQKAFFFKERESGEDFDIIVVDNEADYKDTSIADFFLHNFLNATLFRNNKDNTVNFLKITQKFAAEVYNDADKMYDFTEHMHSLLKTQKNINIHQISEALFSEDSELKSKFVNYFNESGYDTDFTVDKDYVNKRLAKKKYVSSSGITLKIPTALADNNEKFEYKKNEDDTYDIIIKGEKYIIKYEK